MAIRRGSGERKGEREGPVGPRARSYAVVQDDDWICEPSDQSRKNVNALVAGSPPLRVTTKESPPFTVASPPMSVHVIVYVVPPTERLEADPAAARATALPVVVFTRRFTR